MAWLAADRAAGAGWAGTILRSSSRVLRPARVVEPLLKPSLRLLGGVVVEADGVPLAGQIAQRRRLAVLAILGASHRMPVSRDRLVGLLWPELDAEGARHRLSDCLYVARRALGEGAVVAVGDDLRLDDARIDVDVRAFERALDEGATEAAVALFGGPFLDGFHLSDAPEFTAWAEAERARLAGRLARALHALATDAERRSDWPAAVGWLRRLAADDRLAAGPALRLIRALANAGDVAGALRHARVHQALRHAELGLGEDAEVRTAVTALAARSAAPPSEPELVEPLVAPLPPPPAAVPETTVVASAVGDTAVGDTAVGDTAVGDTAVGDTAVGDTAVGDTAVGGTPVAEAPARRSWRPSRPWLLAGCLVLVAAAVLAGSMRWRATLPPTTATAADDPALVGVAVFPFVTHGDAAGDIPGDAIASLLATKLDGGAGLRSVDPSVLRERDDRADLRLDLRAAARVAAGTGARFFVLGEVVHAGGAMSVSASLFDTAGATLVSRRVEVAGPSSAIFQLVDSLAVRLLLGRAGAPAPSLARLAALTTASLPALKAYLDGEALYRRGRYAESAADFERAVAADSTFALAAYRLYGARSWSRVYDAAVIDRALRFSGRLPERLQLLVRARGARHHHDVAAAEGFLRRVTAAYPDEFEGWYELGEVLFHDNPARGRSGVEAREALERAAALDPGGDAEALFHLVQIAALEHRWSALDSLASRFTRAYPRHELGASVRALAALVSDDSARVSAVAQDLARLPGPRAIHAIALAAGVSGRTAAARRLALPLADVGRSRTERGAAWRQLAGFEVVDGDWRAADSLFVLAAATDPAAVLQERARLAAIPVLGAPTETVRAARQALDGASDVREPLRSALVALLALRLGDLPAAQRARDLLAVAPRADEWMRPFVVELTARVLLAEGRAGEALALLDNPAAARPGAHLRFLRAETLERVGRAQLASGWYAAAAEDYDGIFYRDAIARALARLAPLVSGR